MKEKPSVNMESFPLAYVKSVLESVLVHVVNASNDRTFNNYYWYDSLFPEKVGESVLAVHAIKYPELHSLMRNIVQALTGLNREKNTIWSHSSYQAGGIFARELALAHRDDVMLYAQYISTTDLTHEIHYQNEDMLAIISRWGFCAETYMLYIVRWFTPGQNRDAFDYEELKEALKKNNEGAILIKMTAKWFSEKWVSPFAASGVDPVYEFFKEIFEDEHHSDAMDMFHKLCYGEDCKEEELVEIEESEIDSDARANPGDVKLLFDILDHYRRKTLDEDEEKLIDELYTNKESFSQVVINSVVGMMSIAVYKKGMLFCTITLTPGQVIFSDRFDSLIIKDLTKEFQEYMTHI